MCSFEPVNPFYQHNTDCALPLSPGQLTQSLDPPLTVSLRLESEQREWRRKLREGREREARQALLIHKLQNKVRGVRVHRGSEFTGCPSKSVPVSRCLGFLKQGLPVLSGGGVP